jgi:phosphinothricin acetyltransferase
MGNERFVDCRYETHAAAILAILNEVIATSTAIYDYEPRPHASMEPWFRAKAAGNFPVIGLEDAGGELLGLATYGAFRAWPAYKYTVENSVYVRGDARGRGIGKRLLARLVEVASGRDVHVLVAGIDAANAASVALHEQLGFRHAGTVRECGFKFGRWLDLALYQRTLATPARPVDG